MGLAIATGATAMVTRNDGRELWLSLPFGAGAGLTLDELALLVRRDNPYPDSEQFALIQSGVAAAGAAALAARFYWRGASGSDG